MNVLPKGVHSMRIIALPIARVKVFPSTKRKTSPPNASNLLVFYHFDLVSPCGGRHDLSWHKIVLKSVTNKAIYLWTSLGRAPKGSWKLWTYQLGERIADQIEFEELALRSVDPSLGPAVPVPVARKEPVDDVKKVMNQQSPPKIPLIYPPSLYPTRVDSAMNPSLAHLRTLLTDRGPRHQRGFYLWMFIAPLTAPVTLIPVIPNLPLFFCVWRSWSHYRAYRSTQYLSSLLDCGLIDPNPSLELDRLCASFTSSSGIPRGVSPTQTPSPLENDATDRKSEAASGTGPSPQSECTFLTLEAMPKILKIFGLPESTTTDVYRAMNQAHSRMGELQ